MNLVKKTLHCILRSEKGEMGLNRFTALFYEYAEVEG